MSTNKIQIFFIQATKNLINNNSDSSIINIPEEENLKDLIDSANGSPGKILNNIKLWNELPNEIKNNLDFPLKNSLDILKISKIISENLEINQQVFLVNFIQKKYWAKTKNRNIIKN